MCSPVSLTRCQFVFCSLRERLTSVCSDFLLHRDCLWPVSWDLSDPLSVPLVGSAGSRTVIGSCTYLLVIHRTPIIVKEETNSFMHRPIHLFYDLSSLLVLNLLSGCMGATGPTHDWYLWAWWNLQESKATNNLSGLIFLMYWGAFSKFLLSVSKEKK